MALFTDRTMSALEVGLAGEAERQRVTAYNIANVATPSFQARRVRFEDSLARALKSSSSEEVEVDNLPSNTAPRLDGNTVALEEEMTIHMKSGLHYQALVNAVNHKFTSLSAAMGRR